MAESKIITKQLAVVEDLLPGVGKVSQQRSSGIVEVTRINPTEIGGALVVHSIEDLLALDANNLGDTKTIVVQDENRGGIFTYDSSKSSINNNGTILNGFIRQFSGPVDVKWFGAKGDYDGTNGTDDTEAFRKSIAASKDVYISKGKYKITGTLDLPYGTRVHGDRQNSYVYQAPGAVPLFSGKGGLTGSSSDVRDITYFQNWCNVSTPTTFTENRLVMLKSSINSLTDAAGSMQLGFQQNESQIVPFTEYLQVRDIDGDKITFTEDTVFNLYPDTDSKLYNVSMTRCFIDNMHFIKQTHGTLINLDYNENSVVSDNIFASNEYSGAIIWCEHSYKVDIRNNTSYLSPNTVVKYGDDVNPDAYDYYMFNTYKIVSSQQCNVIGNEINNGTQCIDITYTDAPSIMTTVRGNIINSPRHNMATSHWGSFANIFDSNTGNYCQEGIAARSRNDVVTNNVIMGSRETVKWTAEKENTSYGVYMGTGYTVNGNVANNVIHGFSYGIYCTQSSYGGHPWQRVTISNNDVRYCDYAVRVHRYNNDTISKTGMFDATIKNNIFKGNAKSILYIPYEFTNGVYFIDNVILDAPNEDYPVCYIAANSKNIIIKGNIFPALGDSTNGYFVRHYGMTEEADGTDISADPTKNNYDYGQLKVVDNICRDASVHNTNYIRWYDSAVAQNNLPHPNIGADYFKFYSADNDFYVTSELFNLSYDSDNLDEADIHNIYPVVDGMSVTVFGSSNIKLKDDGNIVLNGETSVDLNPSKMTQLTCYSDKWYIH